MKRNTFMAVLLAMLLICSVLLVSCDGATPSGTEEDTTGNDTVISDDGVYNGEDYYADYVDPDQPTKTEDENAPAADAVISFDIAGGTGETPAGISAKVGDVITMPETAPALDGYDFAGWSDGVRYAYPGQAYTVAEETVSFTARYLEKGTTYIMHACDDAGGWWTDTTVETTTGVDGGTALQHTSSKCVILCYAFNNLDLSSMHDGGIFGLDVYIPDASKMKAGYSQARIELSHNSGSVCTYWDIGEYEWQDGWNHLSLPVSEAHYDKADFTALNYFRLFAHVNDEMTIKIDNMIMQGTGDIYGIRYESGFVADEAIVPAETASVAPDTRVILPECSFVNPGFNFVGWNDGETVIPAGERIFMPSHNVIMTAVWEPMPVYTVTFDLDEGKGYFEAVDSFAGEWLRLTTKTPVKAGYSFAGWTDGTKTYKPGETVVMPENNIALTAKWDSIVLGTYADGLVEAWNMNDGGVSGKVLSDTKLGTDGTTKWGTWLNNFTFGQVLDFSTDGSYFLAKDTKVDLSGDFTLAAWVMAPAREDEDRTIIAIGDAKTEEGTSYETIATIDEVERAAGWQGGSLKNEDGRRYYAVSSNRNDAVILKSFSAVDVSKYSMEELYLHVDIYMDTVITDQSQLEITSSGTADKNELGWNCKSIGLDPGWNELYLPLSTGNAQGGEIDLAKVNFIRLYTVNEGEPVTIGIDNIYFCRQVEDKEDNTARFFLNARDNFALDLEVPGIKGIQSSGVSIVDGDWHHVAVTRSGEEITYYIDGEAVKTFVATGSSTLTGKAVYVGADNKGEEGLDGSVSEVRIYNKAKTPADITKVVIDAKDNEPQKTRLTLEKGLVFDRRQYHAPRPYDYEGQTVTKDDIINAMNMGFDHVKLLLTPNHLVNEDGTLKVENMEYITEVVNYVIELDYICYICIHPEQDFKPVYMGDLDNFEILCKWYGELATYIGANWDPDHVGLQLMTEPNSQNPLMDWYWYSDRMWSAVRNVLPDHTIITSSDQSGNIEKLKLMSPASDENLIYSFTTYEPYTIGWYFYGEHSNANSYWKYIKEIPYPVLEGVDYTDAIENSIELVPDNLKAEARKTLTAYVTGDRDNWMDNYYPGTLYNRDWHFLRAESLDNWSKKYGGNIHMMAVEWGCMDNITTNRLWHNNAPEGTGCPDDQRYEYTKDIRESFEEYGIGWSYWSYNEAHTVFLPEEHYYGQSPDPETAIGIFDWVMLEDCLGLKPLVEKPE